MFPNQVAASENLPCSFSTFVVVLLYLLRYKLNSKPIIWIYPMEQSTEKNQEYSHGSCHNQEKIGYHNQ